MTIQLSTAARNAALDAITSGIGASGLLSIYSGTAPATAATALAGNTLLAQLALSATAAPAASGGVLTLNAIATQSSAPATGTATFFRLTTSGGTCIVQGSVGTSGADLNMNSVAISSGAAVAVSSFVLTAANA